MNWDTIRHFKRSEFTCHCCGVEDMHLPFVSALDTVRDKVGFPLVILSGYRCSKHNNIVSETGLNGPHTMGLAADIQCHGGQAYVLLGCAMSMRFLGVGVKQKGEVGARFIHLDFVVSELRPGVWSY